MNPRIQPVRREDADPRSEFEFKRIEALGGYVPNLHLTFGAHPELYQAWMQFFSLGELVTSALVGRGVPA